MTMPPFEPSGIPGERTTGISLGPGGQPPLGLDLPGGYWNALVDLQNAERQRDSLQTLLNRAYRAFDTNVPLSDKELSLFRQNFTMLGIVTEGDLEQSPTLSDMTNQLRTEIKSVNVEVESLTDSLFNRSPQISAWWLEDKLTPERIKDYNLEDPNGLGLVEVDIGGASFRVSAETAASLAQRRYEYNNLSAGEAARLGQDMFFYNNLSAFQVESIAISLRQEDRLDDQLVFQIDDARRNFEQGLVEFESSVALAERGLDLQFMGLQLEHRGQLIAAIGQDYQLQIEKGRMTYEEANLNLNRINAAFTQRRLAREQVLDFAVKESSLRMREGQQVTQLPMASQFAKILGAATGQEFTTADFELATTTIDPNQTMLDVLGASDFASPLPGLAAGLQQSRDAIGALLGAPLGNEAMTETEVEAATQGV